MYLTLLLVSLLASTTLAKDETVLMTEVFEIIVDPPMFNWTFEGVKNQFVYQASLLNAPDLPSWVNFVYSERHHCGFLYGVPPKLNTGKIPLEIVALNKKTYETRHENLNIIVSDKLNPARYEVHMKIDNLNVDDMFDVVRMENLKDIFRKTLWKDSEEDLYVTFLSSALKLGARKPLNPNEGEGVVVRLGSELPFSTELIELQEEIRPLWKVPSCPRDYKRTSVERYFRDAGFALDWCSFRLIDDNNEVMHHSSTHDNSVMANSDGKTENFEDRWRGLSKDEVPIRIYVCEIVVCVLVPIVILIVLVLILSFILCIHHEELKDPTSEDFFANLYHICTDYFSPKSTTTDYYFPNTNQFDSIPSTGAVRGLHRDLSLTPDAGLLPRSHTNSPTSTISRGVHCRPSPPPYVRPKYKPEL